MKPRLLDLFSGAGGAGEGYARAGFDVTGVDVNPQPRYPHRFIQADAMTFPLDGYDVIHASPPCQAYSITKHSHSKSHPELIEPMRRRLAAIGVPYVIENVIGAPLHAPIVLCGTMFDLFADDDDGSRLFLRRHRLFESNVWLTIPVGCRCPDYKSRGLAVGGVYGGGSADRNHAKEVRRGGYTPKKRVRATLIGAPWMTMDELSQAIPPAYTAWIGARLLETLGAVA